MEEPVSAWKRDTCEEEAGRGVNVCTRRSARTGNLSRFIPPR